MESFVLLSLYLKGDVITETIKSLKPFFNINEFDGIYYYRIIIILKTLFVLRTAEFFIPNYVTHLFFAVSNAYVAYVYGEIAIFSATVQCLLIFAPSKKWALCISMGTLCILSMNIKPYECILDLFTISSMVTYACEAYHKELQKLSTVVSIVLTVGWHVSNLHIFSLKKFFLIIGFLFLAYLPLKPNFHNKHRHRLIYFYMLMFLWIVYKFQVASYHQIQAPLFKTGVSDFNKEIGDYDEQSATPELVRASLNKFIYTKTPVEIQSDLFMKRHSDGLTNNFTSTNEMCFNFDERDLSEKLLSNNLGSACQKVLHCQDSKDLMYHEIGLTEKIMPAEKTVNLKIKTENSVKKSKSIFDKTVSSSKINSKTGKDMLRNIPKQEYEFKQPELNEKINEDSNFTEVQLMKIPSEKNTKQFEYCCKQGKDLRRNENKDVNIIDVGKLTDKEKAMLIDQILISMSKPSHKSSKQPDSNEKTSAVENMNESGKKASSISVKYYQFEAKDEKQFTNKITKKVTKINNKVLESESGSELLKMDIKADGCVNEHQGERVTLVKQSELQDTEEKRLIKCENQTRETLNVSKIVETALEVPLLDEPTTPKSMEQFFKLKSNENTKQVIEGQFLENIAMKTDSIVKDVRPTELFKLPDSITKCIAVETDKTLHDEGYKSLPISDEHRQLDVKKETEIMKNKKKAESEKESQVSKHKLNSLNIDSNTKITCKKVQRVKFTEEPEFSVTETDLQTLEKSTERIFRDISESVEASIEIPLLDEEKTTPHLKEQLTKLLSSEHNRPINKGKLTENLDIKRGLKEEESAIDTKRKPLVPGKTKDMEENQILGRCKKPQTPTKTIKNRNVRGSSTREKRFLEMDESHAGFETTEKNSTVTKSYTMVEDTGSAEIKMWNSISEQTSNTEKKQKLDGFGVKQKSTENVLKSENVQNTSSKENRLMKNYGQQEVIKADSDWQEEKVLFNTAIKDIKDEKSMKLVTNSLEEGKLETPEVNNIQKELESMENVAWKGNSKKEMLVEAKMPQEWISNSVKKPRRSSFFMKEFKPVKTTRFENGVSKSTKDIFRSRKSQKLIRIPPFSKVAAKRIEAAQQIIISEPSFLLNENGERYTTDENVDMYLEESIQIKYMTNENLHLSASDETMTDESDINNEEHFTLRKRGKYYIL